MQRIHWTRQVTLLVNPLSDSITVPQEDGNGRKMDDSAIEMETLETKGGDNEVCSQSQTFLSTE